MKYTLILLLFCSVVTPLKAQQPNPPQSALQRVLQNFNKYQQDYPDEKVYLQLDKPYYAAGEDIWFKGYITVSQFNFLSGISRLLYVDLINRDNEIVQSRRLPILAGLAVGDFKLPDTLQSGNYRIRAYTNWMRNFGDDFFFDRTITIGNSLTQDIVASSKFTMNADEKGGRILQANIQLTHIGGAPLADEQVSYEVEWGARRIAKDKARLSNTGELMLSVKLKDPSTSSNGKLILNIGNGVQRLTTKVIVIQNEDISPVITLYPEGGTLLANTLNKVVFRTVGANGQGVAVNGSLEHEGQQLMTFTSDDHGIGNFSFTPESNKTYQVVATFPDEKHITAKLPAATTNGYAMAVNNAIGNAVWIQLTGPADLGKQSFSVVAQHHGQVFYAAKTTLTNQNTTLHIARKDLPSGVINLLLLDEQANLLAERAIFNLNDTDVLPVQVIANKPTYKARERVSLTVSAPGLDDSLRMGCFSMAVTNLTKVPDSAQNDPNILSTLWLTSAIGQTDRPGDYFKNTNNAIVRRRVDNLLITQKMDSTFWGQVQKDHVSPPIYTAEKSMRISGKIAKRNGEPISEAKVTVISPQNILAMLDTVTQADGRFSFDDIVFADSTNFVVQARDAKGKKNVEILMDSVPRQKVSSKNGMFNFGVDANQLLENYLISANKQLTELQKFGLLERSIQLDEVEVTAKKESPAKYSSNLNGPGNADQVISGDDPFFGSCGSLDICLNGRLTGVIFKNGVPYSTRSPNRAMQIVLDGMYMDGESLSTISPMDVASVEVLRNVGNTAIYGSYGAGGVLIITTRRGDQPRKYQTDLYTPGILTFRPQGLYQARTFHAPDYSVAEQKVGMKDLRTTIYWAPNLITNKKGQVEVSFYTADEPGVYQIVVEGIDTQGHLGRSVSYIKVE